MYIQKPYDTGYTFNNTLKFFHICEIFLTTIRTKRLKTRNIRLLNKAYKKDVLRILEPSVYKIINFRLNSLNEKIGFFLNYGSRSKIFPALPGIQNFKNHNFKYKKKLKILTYSHLLIKAIPLAKI
jgi:hypothetical protein